MEKDQQNITDLVPKTKPYKVGVGGSMFLQVMPNGGKYWRFSYRFNGKQKTLAVGTYPEISQKEAEKIRDEAKDLISQNIDPADVKRKKQNEKIIEAQKPTLTPKAVKTGGFRLSMLDDETFFIENSGQSLFLNYKQAVAVFTFLDSSLNMETR